MSQLQTDLSTCNWGACLFECNRSVFVCPPSCKSTIELCNLERGQHVCFCRGVFCTSHILIANPLFFQQLEEADVCFVVGLVCRSNPLTYKWDAFVFFCSDKSTIDRNNRGATSVFFCSGVCFCMDPSCKSTIHSQSVGRGSVFVGGGVQLPVCLYGP